MHIIPVDFSDENQALIKTIKTNLQMGIIFTNPHYPFTTHEMGSSYIEYRKDV
jgi:hypothetical protein